MATRCDQQPLKHELVQGTLLLSTMLVLAGCAGSPASRSAAPPPRTGFLNEQFSSRNPVLPDVIAGQIDSMEVAHADAAELLAATNAEYKRINTLTDGPDKEQARKTLNDRGNALAYQAARRDLLRALYSPAQLQEQLAWFWLNHFNVAQSKASIRWLRWEAGSISVARRRCRPASSMRSVANSA